jgi:putative transcriptional regulator
MHLLDSIGDEDPFAGFLERLSDYFDLPAHRVREILGALSQLDEDAWETDRPGTRLHHFDGGPRVSEADCGLVRMEPGARYPAHRHLGAEWAFVLRGRAEEDETGAVWEPGDLVHRAADSVHAFRVLGDEPFVFAIVLHDGIERP